ncbi:MAG: hypothetical protein UY48_C0052G0004 [Candidatus Gottesmanbacteria bacterium GW2011_GWB1_49_7]|uniref:Uncharacterized protein n=1 Tax=Candidatus Gottesmanbacteria bacterium GW2011_GWB1_49_7 TaxID=1618448 RepID=A0A0G1VU49_9BACT|nr:MAG: hypothetical protein UY48_C0052G0004 [Candidatus Gottesmanbacteria bacterium GW2011_GWB1_49_7]
MGAQISTGDVVNVSMGSTNVAGGAFVVADAGGTRTDAIIDITSASTASTDAGSIVQLNATGALASGANILDINASGGVGGNGLDITTSGTLMTGNLIDLNLGTGIADSGDAINIAMGSTGTAAQGLVLTNAAAATVNLVDLSASAITTGNILNVSSTSASTSFSGTLGYFEWDPSSTTTASTNLFTINIASDGTTTGDLFQIQDGGSDLFRINESIITSAIPHEFTAAGDVSMAYDLIFTNETSSMIEARGPLTIRQGDSFDSNPLTLQVYNAGNVVVDGSTDVNSSTGGVLDLNVNSLTANNIGLNIDYIIDTGTTSATELFGSRINITQNDADVNAIGLEINAANSTAAIAGAYEALIRINGNDTTANAVTDYILITTAATDTTSDAIDVSDADLFNALNVGPNTITGTAYSIFSTAGNLALQANFNTANLLLSGGDTLPSSVADGNDLEARAEDDIFLNPTDDVRLYANGAALDCSGAGNGGLLTTDVNGIIACGADDGAGAATTLQTAYDNDADGGNATITLTANDDGIVFTNPDATGNDLSAFVFQINQSDTDAAIAALDITQTSTNAAASAINITSAVATTSNIIAFDNTGNAAWTGNIVDITTGTGNATGNLIDLAIEDSANDDVQAIVLNAAGALDQAGWAYEVNATGAFTAAAFDIDSAAANTGSIFHVDNSGNAAWTGHILDVETGTGDYTGNIIDVFLEASTANDGQVLVVVNDDESDQAGWLINTDAQAAFTSSMIQFDSTTNDAWTGNLIDIDTGTGNVSGNIIDVNFEATTNNDAQFLVLANADESDQAGWLIDVDTSAAWTANAIDFTTGAQAWTGNVMDFNFGNAAATGDVINIDIPALAVGAQAFVLTDAAANTVDLFDISSTGITTGRIADINAATNTFSSGTLLNLSTTSTGLTGSSTTGSLLNVSATGAASGFAGNLAYIEWAPTTITGSGNLLTVNIGANGTTTGDLFQVQDTGSDLFRVNESIITSALPHEFTAAGDVSIAYDIQFTNQTSSSIKSKAPLIFDVGESFESNTATFNIYNAGGVVIDGSTDVNTSTTGVLDLNVNSITASNVGFNVDYTSNDGVTSGDDLFAAKINLTQNDANGDLFGLLIDAAATTNAAAGSYEYLLRLNNNETTANSVTDYLLINTASTPDTTVSDAIAILKFIHSLDF